MLKFHDRNKKELLYGPTNEELITDIFQTYVTSYKELPKNLYHIQWKFRDEVRPRFGVMRGREFLMKDNYSFDLSKEEAIALSFSNRACIKNGDSLSNSEMVELVNRLFGTNEPFICPNGNVILIQISLNEIENKLSTLDNEELRQKESILNKHENDKEFFHDLCSALENIYEHVRGAYSVIALVIGKGLVAFRDPQGIRPLVKGIRSNSSGEHDYIIASENTMFYPLGFKPNGNVLPGELIYISERGKVFSKRIVKKSFNPCIFEYVYFARPDATLKDVSVYRARLRMGQNLAERWKNKYPKKVPDIIIPAPSTANTAALSMATALGVRYSEGLYKNPFIGRTFIMPGQKARKKSLRYKLTPQVTEISEKKVMIVDDSIVRGNTSREIVRMLKDFGATEVYFAVACPPVQSPCFYGVDMPTRAELIANNKSVDEIRQYLDVDLLFYQNIDDLAEAVMRKGDHHIDRPCMACFDKHYITSEMNNKKIQQLESIRINERNGN